MRTSRFLVYSAFSGMFLSIPWIIDQTGIILLLALIPLFWVEAYIFHQYRKPDSGLVFLYSSITFFCWNFITTRWLGNASVGAAVAAVMINTFLMASVFTLFHVIKRQIKSISYLILIALWLGFEYLYFRTEISWPWLTLGHGLANDIRLIQWYEYTGVLGGSLWILLSNQLLFSMIQSGRPFLVSRNAVNMLLILFPAVLSLYLYNTRPLHGKEIRVAVIQPNLDPYAVYPEGLSEREKTDRLVHLYDSIDKEEADMVVAPEVYFKANLWENRLESHPLIRDLNSWFGSDSTPALLTGITSYRAYRDKGEMSNTARFSKQLGYYFDSYNTAMFMASPDEIQLRHKSKLVLGVEKVPFHGTFLFLDSLSARFGGISGSQGTDEEKKLFRYQGIPFGAFICYESVYGDYIRQFVDKGARFLIVITNDGWWDNTPGHRQHLSYSRIRAIENRRYLARAAINGVSCFINEKGEITGHLPYETMGALQSPVPTTASKTFYTRNGDYIGRVAVFFSVLLLAYMLVSLIMNKKGRTGNFS